ncbi:hypothetical protein FNF31_03978 [Cafeteria roenbergensis]|uniref:TBC1 domain family member 31 n=1 Tax=Cafeteria roenbergensis TaxID=33653 RepID=A0A5A8D903_CAFRO|nr:hypothetical protein FNF31_03978 [Cafeteria roenbergensis]
MHGNRHAWVGHSGSRPTAAAFGPTLGARDELYLGCADGAVRVFGLGSPDDHAERGPPAAHSSSRAGIGPGAAPLAVLRAHRAAVQRVVASPDGSLLLTVSAERAIIWETATWTRRRTLRAGAAIVDAAFASVVGRLGPSPSSSAASVAGRSVLVAGFRDDSVVVWLGDTLSPVAKLTVPPKEASTGSVLSSVDAIVTVGSPDGGEAVEAGLLAGHEARACPPWTALVAAGTRTGSVLVWTVSPGAAALRSIVDMPASAAAVVKVMLLPRAAPGAGGRGLHPGSLWGVRLAVLDDAGTVRVLARDGSAWRALAEVAGGAAPVVDVAVRWAGAGLLGDSLEGGSLLCGEEEHGQAEGRGIASSSRRRSRPGLGARSASPSRSATETSSGSGPSSAFLGDGGRDRDIHGSGEHTRGAPVGRFTGDSESKSDGASLDVVDMEVGQEGARRQTERTQGPRPVRVTARARVSVTGQPAPPSQKRRGQLPVAWDAASESRGGSPAGASGASDVVSGSGSGSGSGSSATASGAAADGEGGPASESEYRHSESTWGQRGQAGHSSSSSSRSNNNGRSRGGGGLASGSGYAAGAEAGSSATGGSSASSSGPFSGRRHGATSADRRRSGGSEASGGFEGGSDQSYGEGYDEGEAEEEAGWAGVPSRVEVLVCLRSDGTAEVFELSSALRWRRRVQLRAAGLASGEGRRVEALMAKGGALRIGRAGRMRERAEAERAQAEADGRARQEAVAARGAAEGGMPGVPRPVRAYDGWGAAEGAVPDVPDPARIHGGNVFADPPAAGWSDRLVLTGRQPPSSAHPALATALADAASLAMPLDGDGGPQSAPFGRSGRRAWPPAHPRSANPNAPSGAGAERAARGGGGLSTATRQRLAKRRVAAVAAVAGASPDRAAEGFAGSFSRGQVPAVHQLAAMATGGSAVTDASLRALLQRGGGAFPDDQRLLAWRFLLRLPGNARAFHDLRSAGQHPAFDDLGDRFPMRSRRLLSALQDTVSVLAHWCPALADAPWLPNFVFPFVKLTTSGSPAPALVRCELCIAMVLNFAATFLQAFPMAPVQTLGAAEAALRTCDPRLADHLAMLGVTPERWAWPLLRSAFSEALPRSRWVRLWDGLVARAATPARAVAAAVAYLRLHRSRLLAVRAPARPSLNGRGAAAAAVLAPPSHAGPPVSPGTAEVCALLRQHLPTDMGALERLIQETWQRVPADVWAVASPGNASRLWPGIAGGSDPDGAADCQGAPGGAGGSAAGSGAGDEGGPAVWMPQADVYPSLGRFPAFSVDFQLKERERIRRAFEAEERRFAAAEAADAEAMAAAARGRAAADAAAVAVAVEERRSREAAAERAQAEAEERAREQGAQHRRTAALAALEAGAMDTEAAGLAASEHRLGVAYAQARGVLDAAREGPGASGVAWVADHSDSLDGYAGVDGEEDGGEFEDASADGAAVGDGRSGRPEGGGSAEGGRAAAWRLATGRMGVDNPISAAPGDGQRPKEL